VGRRTKDWIAAVLVNHLVKKLAQSVGTGKSKKDVDQFAPFGRKAFDIAINLFVLGIDVVRGIGPDSEYLLNGKKMTHFAIQKFNWKRTHVNFVWHQNFKWSCLGSDPIANKRSKKVCWEHVTDSEQFCARIRQDDTSEESPPFFIITSSSSHCPFQGNLLHLFIGNVIC
jgi:hypothetical protein